MASKKICSIDGCGKPFIAKKLCRPHYYRMAKYGDPMAGGTFIGEPLRFLNSVFEMDRDDCIAWPYARSNFGYGKVWKDGKLGDAHRIICTGVHGNPPTANHEAAHSCGKGSEGCVNPRHLSWKTPKENQMDKIIHGTTNRGERNGKRKLTEDQARFIKFDKSITHRQLSQITGASLSTVCSIKMGHRWGWLKAQEP